MYNNTYVQNRGALLGQFGSKENGIPEMLYYDDSVEQTIKEIIKDENATVIFCD